MLFTDSRTRNLLCQLLELVEHWLDEFRVERLLAGRALHRWKDHQVLDGGFSGLAFRALFFDEGLEVDNVASRDDCYELRLVHIEAFLVAELQQLERS